MAQRDPVSLPTTSKPPNIILELMPESDETSPALVNEIGRAVVEALQRDGYELRPVYTGTRGGPFLVEVVNAIGQAASYVWANHAAIEEVINDTSALVTIMGGVIPLIRRLVHAHETQVGAEEARVRPIKVTVIIDGSFIEVEAQDAEQVDAALAAAKKFATAHPQIAPHVSAKSKTTVQGRIAGKPRRRRK